MMSELEGIDGQHQEEMGDSDNNSSDFSDDDLDDSDDLDIEDLDLIEREDLDEDNDSCLIDQDSSRMLEYHNFVAYQNQNLHDAEVMSQTITSDLDADLHSYKKENENEGYHNYNDNMEDNEYLNGSTAGFGKKLREINREINQEDEKALNLESL